MRTPKGAKTMKTTTDQVKDQVPASRTPLHLDVSFKKNYARKDTFGTLKNISITGAFLEVSEHDLRKNEKLNLTFVVAQRERKIAAEVVWANSVGVGVKFLPQNARDIQIIDDLIYFVETKRMGFRDTFSDFLKKAV